MSDDVGMVMHKKVAVVRSWRQIYQFEAARGFDRGGVRATLVLVGAAAKLVRFWVVTRRGPHARANRTCRSGRGRALPLYCCCVNLRTVNTFGNLEMAETVSNVNFYQQPPSTLTLLRIHLRRWYGIGGRLPLRRVPRPRPQALAAPAVSQPRRPRLEETQITKKLKHYGGAGSLRCRARRFHRPNIQGADAGPSHHRRR